MRSWHACWQVVTQLQPGRLGQMGQQRLGQQVQWCCVLLYELLYESAVVDAVHWRLSASSCGHFLGIALALGLVGKHGAFLLGRAYPLHACSRAYKVQCLFAKHGMLDCQQLEWLFLLDCCTVAMLPCACSVRPTLKVPYYDSWSMQQT